jgi:hypothetical protein
MKIIRFPDRDMVMRFYGGSVVGHIYADLQLPRDGHAGDQSSISQDPHAVSDNILESELETDADDPDLEFTLDARDDDDWDGAEDGIDDGDDSHYIRHVADELFAPIGDE